MPKVSTQYAHLLSPVKVGNHVFKNRMIATTSVPTLLQGPEKFPNEGIITHFVNKARSGAALIIFGIGDADPLKPKPPVDILKHRAENPNTFNPDHSWYANSGRPFRFDIVNGGCQNYFSQMVEAIHFYDSKCIMMMRVEPPHGYDISIGNAPDDSEEGSGGGKVWGKELSEEMLLGKLLDEYELQAVLAKEMGFDGVSISMAYQAPLTARLLSPLTNKRTDSYGGSLENRARFSLMVIDRIRERCGKDFIIHATLSAWEPEGGYSLEDAVEYAKIFAGHIDMLQLRGPTIDLAHPSNFTLERTPYLHAAELIKKKVPHLTLITNGGFQDLDDCEEALATGKADFVGMARAWICNPDFGDIAYEGRNEDIVPCLRCNMCQLPGYYKPWTAYCAVNPVWGLEHKIHRMISPPEEKKKIAVIGGGIAGMKAALTASQRGHEVTLYEKNDSLGGTLTVYQDVSFKWPHKNFKKYLIHQIAKSTVKVCLNTEADAKMIQKVEYDAVIAAVGADPVIPDFIDINNKNVFLAIDVYGNEGDIAKDVVVIGGGQTGVETGMHLAENGHTVTVLEKANMLARDAVPVHYYTMFREAWEKLPNFTGIADAHCTSVSADGTVLYLDKCGDEQELKTGSVIIAAGMQPKSDLALTFHHAGSRLYLVGDCKEAADIQKAMRSAFSSASTI